MKYWIQSNGGAPLLIRAAHDPRENFDVVPQVWHSGDRRWVDDDEIGGEMMWDPNIRPAVPEEVQLIERSADGEFVTDWLAAAASLRGDLELPARSAARQFDLH